MFIPTLKTWSSGPPARRPYASESQVREDWLCRKYMPWNDGILKSDTLRSLQHVVRKNPIIA